MGLGKNQSSGMKKVQKVYIYNLMRCGDGSGACRKLFVGGAGFATKVPEKGWKTAKGQQSWPMPGGICPGDGMGSFLPASTDTL